MDIDTLVKKYAKKIYGFAYSKTHNYYEAEDLSSDIVLTLCKINFDKKEIFDMDAYIYRICQFSWSNFVRKNKHYWENCVYIDEAFEKADNTDILQDLINKELYKKLRYEIMYLSKNKRKCTIMYYYEEKSIKEISQNLKIPESTVKWYLGESRKLLKERIEMKENNGIFTPKKLKIYFSGNSNTHNLQGLRNDMLMHNICIVCEENALTIEEIATALCISAAFLEDKIETLVWMNYLEKIGNKYKTTFFIKNNDYILAEKRFIYEKLPVVASSIYETIKRHLNKIKSIGFIGCDLNENFLMWCLVTRVAHDFECGCMNNYKCTYQAPIRGDGSQHWIDATYDTENYDFSNLNDDFADFIENCGGCAGKHQSSKNIIMQQFDPFIVGERGILNDSTILSIWEKLDDIAKQKADVSEYEKEIISIFIKKGYVSLTNGKLTLNVPYFNSEQYEKFVNVIENDILPEICENDIMTEYANFINKLIPSYISKSEKEHEISNFYQPNAYAYILYKQGKLKEPTDEEKKSLCTIIYHI